MLNSFIHIFFVPEIALSIIAQLVTEIYKKI